MTQPKILNLDDLETPDTQIAIVHEGVSHSMRVLDVDQFIVQQKRAAETQRLAIEAGKDVNENDLVSVVEIIRDSIHEFFPTLPVGGLPTQKMFMIFAWLNELSSEINNQGAPDSGEGVESAEGNVQEAAAS